MTLEQLLNMEPKDRPPRLTIQEAAEIMDVIPRFLHMGLQHEKFDFGVAIKTSAQWTYYINTERFIKYMLGEDMYQPQNENARQLARDF